ncbi:hypothetical protein NMG60_11015330 [Bertholletia excelsa]
MNIVTLSSQAPSAGLRPSFFDMALRFNCHSLRGFKECLQCIKTHNCILVIRANRVGHNAGPKVLCAANMTAGQSGDSGRINLDNILNKAREVWESSPQPVKIFPWNRALDNFIQLILDLILAVVKCLSVPLLGVSSLSEMSYCAHERKLLIVPVPLLVGFIVAGILRDTALELSPSLKEAEVPWHLIAIAILFTLLKLPGPYYPYWRRVIIPHLANGGLLRTLYFAFLWYKRPKQSSGKTPTE